MAKRRSAEPQSIITSFDDKAIDGEDEMTERDDEPGQEEVDAYYALHPDDAPGPCFECGSWATSQTDGVLMCGMCRVEFGYERDVSEDDVP